MARTCILLILFVASVGGTLLMSGETTPTPDELQKQIDYLNKQKELADAQKALLDSQKALADAQKPPDPSLKQLQDESAAAKAAKDLADAQKALADAKKAASDSQLAAFKAAVGDVPASGISGSVDLKEKAGQLEATLLAAKAVREASASINNEVRKVLADGTRIVLFASGDLPTFQSLIAYKAQYAIVNKALTVAIQNSSDLQQRSGVALEAVPIVGAAGIALDSVNKLLSYFRTDYTVGGVELSLDDALLVNGVSDLLRTSADNKSYVVSVPGIYNPSAISTAGTSIITDLSGLSALKQVAAARAKQHDDASDRLTKQSSSEKDETKKAELLKKAQQQKQMATDLRAATGVFDAWFGKVSSLDDKGTVPLVSVIREQSIQDQLANAQLLVVKIQKAGGGYLMKKNVWTFFGGMPLYHMGGVTATYTLLDGKDGHVLAAGTVPVHGGFIKAGELRDYLSQ
jgi:hypothetical protein